MLAAIAYLCSPGDEIWPFLPEEFRPCADPVVNLIEAATLLAAEGDRIMRARLEGRTVTSGLIVLGLDPEELTRCVDGLRNIRAEIRDIRDGEVARHEVDPAGGSRFADKGSAGT